MAENRNVLRTPPAVEDDDAAIEMARVWIAQRGLHCALNVGNWHKDSDLDERDCWGVMLADMARHISNAIEEVTGLDRRESLQMVVTSFNSEIRNATSDHQGQRPTMDDPAS